jgi:hypothetical protein
MKPPVKKSKGAQCTRLRRQRLRCVTCHRSYPYAEESGKPPIIDFGGNEPPTPNCRTHKNDALCRFHVADRRTASAADLAGLLSDAEEIAWVTAVLRELSLDNAAELKPALEVGRLKRWLSKALFGLLPSEIANISPPYSNGYMIFTCTPRNPFVKSVH